MAEEIINFRGVKEGIFVDIKGGNLDIIKKELDKKLKDTYNFYKGTKLLGILADALSEDEQLELKLILKYKYDFIVTNEKLPKHLLSPPIAKEEFNSNNKNENSYFEGIDCGMTKFVNGTLRSGQVVEYDGNIVVIGDVNPGALILARGNIIIFGTLRGVAHAGIGGNLDSIVASYNLQPTQLRIGDMIARPPDDGNEEYTLPEIARVKDGEVIIEPYLPNK